MRGTEYAYRKAKRLARIGYPIPVDLAFELTALGYDLSEFES